MSSRIEAKLKPKQFIQAIYLQQGQHGKRVAWECYPLQRSCGQRLFTGTRAAEPTEAKPPKNWKVGIDRQAAMARRSANKARELVSIAHIRYRSTVRGSTINACCVARSQSENSKSWAIWDSRQIQNQTSGYWKLIDAFSLITESIWDALTSSENEDGTSQKNQLQTDTTETIHFN